MIVLADFTLAELDDEELRRLRADIDALLVTREAGRQRTILGEHHTGEDESET